MTRFNPSHLFDRDDDNHYIQTNSIAIIGNLPTTSLLYAAIRHLSDSTSSPENRVLILSSNRNSLVSALTEENLLSQPGLSSSLLSLLDRIDLK